MWYNNRHCGARCQPHLQWVINTPTVPYSTPLVCYAYFIFYIVAMLAWILLKRVLFVGKYATFSKIFPQKAPF